MFDKQETILDIAKWGYLENSCHFWQGDSGRGALYLTVCIDKSNSIPSNETINMFVCSLFNVKVRGFDDEYLDKKSYWTKTFSFSVK